MWNEASTQKLKLKIIAAEAGQSTPFEQLELRIGWSHFPPNSPAHPLATYYMCTNIWKSCSAGDMHNGRCTNIYLNGTLYRRCMYM